MIIGILILLAVIIVIQTAIIVSLSRWVKTWRKVAEEGVVILYSTLSEDEKTQIEGTCMLNDALRGTKHVDQLYKMLKSKK